MAKRRALVQLTKDSESIYEDDALGPEASQEEIQNRVILKTPIQEAPQSSAMKALLADLRKMPSPSLSKYLCVEQSPTKVLPQASEFVKTFAAEGFMSFNESDRGTGKVELLECTKDGRKVVYLIFRNSAGRILFQGKVNEATKMTKEEDFRIESNVDKLPEYSVEKLLTSEGLKACRLATASEFLING